MSNPITAKVEIAFSDGPMVAAPTYTDVSAYVSLSSGVTFNRGRGEYATTPEPGRLSLTLNNDDNRFTWGKVGGANALGRGDKPPLRQPIRLTLTYDSTATVVWTGYVDEWSQEWAGGFRPRVRVTASDMLAKLALLKLDDGAIRSEVLYDSPIAYYPLSEEAGKVSAGNQAGTQSWGSLAAQDFGAGSGTIDFGAGAAPDGVGTAVAFTQSSSSNGKALVGTGAGGLMTQWSVELWVLPSTWSGTAGQGFVGIGGAPYILGVLPCSITYNPAFNYLIFTRDNIDSWIAIHELVAGSWHHLVMTCDGTYLRGYVNAVEIDPDSGSKTLVGSGAIDLGAVTVGSIAPNVGTYTNYLFQDGQIAHVAVYDTALSAARIAQHYAAGKAAGSFYGEPASDRFDRLCRLSGLPSALYATDATATTLVGAQSLGGIGMLEAIQQVTDSERGAVYLAGTGVLTYRSTATVGGAAVGATLTNTDIDGDLALVLNDLTVANDVTVSREGGATQRRTDATSQAVMGITNATTVATILTTDAEAAALAELLLSQGTAVQPRTGNLTVDLVTRAATVDVLDVLALDTGARVQVTNLPASFPADSIDLLVDGVAGTVSDKDAKVTLTVRPVLTVEPWLLDDATYSVLGQTTRLGY